MIEPPSNVPEGDKPKAAWRTLLGVAVLATALGVVGTLAVVTITERAGTSAPAKTMSQTALAEAPVEEVIAPEDVTTVAPSTTTTLAPVQEPAAPPTIDDPGVDDPGLDDHDMEFAEPDPLATFNVAGDRLVVEGASPELGERAATVWNRFVQLVPVEERLMVSAFELMDAGYEGAHVYPTDDDPTRWVLGVSEGLGRDLDETLLHEWGHLVTLSASEVPPNPNALGCKTYFTGEGCALPESTFARFVAAFWPQDLIDEVEGIYLIEDEDEYFDAMDAFLAEHESEFVTEYAATNPGEDLAETVAVFILTDRPDGDEVRDAKVLFLWDDPNFVTLRERIRGNL